MKEKPEKIKDFLGHENSKNFRWKELVLDILELNTMEDFEDK